MMSLFVFAWFHLYFLLCNHAVASSEVSLQNFMGKNNEFSLQKKRRRIGSVPQSMRNFDDNRPSSANCTYRYFDQPLDHFSSAGRHEWPGLKQRACFYENYVPKGKKPSAILFYVGNESPVDIYVNNTGLMWDLGAELQASVIFAEHRYEGYSVPDLDGKTDCMAYVSSKQALADYALLLQSLQLEEYYKDVPIVVFGGSYGGMLAAWMRAKYPHLIAGAIAGSAPIFGIPTFIQDKKINKPDGSTKAVTRSLTKAGGLQTDFCASNMHAAWPLIAALLKDKKKLGMVKKQLRLCTAPKGEEDAGLLLNYLQAVFFLMAEGNYPFPSNYISSAVGGNTYLLPAWPMKEACKTLDKDISVRKTNVKSEQEYEYTYGGQDGYYSVEVAGNAIKKTDFQGDDSVASELLDGVASAVGVWYNISQSLTCLDWTAPAPNTEKNRETSLDKEHICQTNTTNGHFDNAFAWNPLVCNEQMNIINTFSQGLGEDFFWPSSGTKDVEGLFGRPMESLIDSEKWIPTECASDFKNQHLFGVTNRTDDYGQELFAYYGDVTDATRIIYSNGLLDPWSAGGIGVPDLKYTEIYDGPVVKKLGKEDVFAVLIAHGGHHLDLMFPTDDDPPEVVEARAFEKKMIKKWIGYSDPPVVYVDDVIIG